MFLIETYIHGGEDLDEAEAETPEAALLAVETLLQDDSDRNNGRRHPFIRARVTNLESGKVVWTGNTVATSA